MTRIFAVHTAMALVEPVTRLFREHLPDVGISHIADDSLIREVIAAGEVTAAVRRRLLAYYFAAVDGGADGILNCCSSVGAVADGARRFLPVPLFRIDEPMARLAVEAGSRIGVLATLATTLEPTVALLRVKAAEAGQKIGITEGLAGGAFQAAMAGDQETHDRLIREAATRIAAQCDLLVLAQGSMARMEPSLREITGKPVLSSPLSGVLAIRDFLTAGKNH